MNDPRHPTPAPAPDSGAAPSGPGDTASALDDLRAWAEGTLEPHVLRAFEARLAADPALACDAVAYRAVHRLTQPLLDERLVDGRSVDGGLVAGPSRTALRFEDLPLEDEPSFARRHAAWLALAAAAVVLLSLGLWWRAWGTDAPAPGRARVTLAHLRPHAAPAAEAPEAHLLQGYRPVRDGAIAWLSSEVEARTLAAASGRRVLVYARHPECPWCRTLDRGAWVDHDVQRALAAFVPLRLDVTTLPEPEAMRLFEAGWPYLAVTDAAGTRLAFFPGQHDAASMRAQLAEAEDPAADRLPTWADLEVRARAQDAARVGAAALREAAAAPADAAPTVRARLTQLAAEYAGGPAGDDLARVLQAWREGTAFPDLVEAPR